MIGIVTFGDDRLKRSLKRFQAQACCMDVFDRVSINSEADLPLWYRKHAERLIRGSRGFGYYCRKPQIVLQTLMMDGSVASAPFADNNFHFLHHDLADQFKSASALSLPHRLDKKNVSHQADIEMPAIWWKS